MSVSKRLLELYAGDAFPFSPVKNLLYMSVTSCGLKCVSFLLHVEFVQFRAVTDRAGRRPNLQLNFNCLF